MHPYSGCSFSCLPTAAVLKTFLLLKHHLHHLQKIESDENMEIESQLEPKQVIEDIVEPTQTRKKHRMELGWILTNATDRDQSFKQLQNGFYKMSVTHMGAERRCTVHANKNDHKMYVSYYSCTSKHCIRDSNVDKCEYKNHVRHCQDDQQHYIYQVRSLLVEYIFHISLLFHINSIVKQSSFQQIHRRL